MIWLIVVSFFFAAVRLLSITACSTNSPCLHCDVDMMFLMWQAYFIRLLSLLVSEYALRAYDHLMKTSAQYFAFIVCSGSQATRGLG